MADRPSICSVMPWWYVGGTLISFAAALVLAPAANLVVAPLISFSLIVSTVRERRAGDPSWSRRSEAAVAFVMFPLALGVAALASQVPFFRDGDFDSRFLLGGILSLAASGIVFLVARAVQRARRADRP